MIDGTHALQLCATFDALAGQLIQQTLIAREPS